MSTYDGGPFPHSDGHGDNGRGDGGQPGGNGQAGRAGEPEYGAYAPQGQPAGRQYPYGGAPQDGASSGQYQTQPGVASDQPGRRSANSSPASSKGRAAGRTSARSG